MDHKIEYMENPAARGATVRVSGREYQLVQVKGEATLWFVPRLTTGEWSRRWTRVDDPAVYGPVPQGGMEAFAAWVEAFVGGSGEERTVASMLDQFLGA